ncbi:MAG: GntR family transcriptional regulator [Armatimonadota bacterium]|nr:GntR family transcriptional regulator [Armatimonadota bacterium]
MNPEEEWDVDGEWYLVYNSPRTMSAFNLLITENVPVRDLALEKLRNAILSGYFKPGDRLIERELCKKMGISRTPIREAIRKLEQEGLITTIPYKGPIVTVLSPEDIEEVFQVRAVLEGLAIRLLATRQDIQAIQAMRKAVEAGERALERGSLRALVATNRAFHEAISKGSGNKLLQSLLSNLRARIGLLRVQSLSLPGRPEESVREHRQLLRAVERGLPDEGEALMRAHVARAREAAWKQLTTLTKEAKI